MNLLLIIQSKRRKENNICSHTQCGVNQRYMEETEKEEKGKMEKQHNVHFTCVNIQIVIMMMKNRNNIIN
jgi:hypothetical protein